MRFARVSGRLALVIRYRTAYRLAPSRVAKNSPARGFAASARARSSGTVIRVGEALIRLTFHCEPCKKIRHLVTFDRILHKRGYLGSFLNSGAISVGDAVTVTEQKLEAIPYAVKDRIRWYFARQNAVPGVKDLLDAAHQSR